MENVKDAIQQVCEEKNISVESVLETIEAALAAAYRKDFGQKNQNIKVNFDLDTNSMDVFDIKIVVEDMDMEELEQEKEEYLAKKEAGEEVDEESLRRFNPKTEIMLAEAKELKKKVEIGQEVKTKLEIPDEFGRMAAQTAKQVIIQRLREAEREVVYNEFKEREGEVLTGSVQRREGRMVFVDIGQTMAIMPPDEQISNERYESGQRFKFLLTSVKQTPKGPELIVSRVHPDMIKALFRTEVPEIEAETVEIKAIAREAGSRSKIAVTSNQENIDPVGSCVGQRGTRVQTIIAELGGEKIDIIEWSENVEKFISQALSPAKVIGVTLNEKNKSAKVKVKEDQLSLAIGREGQNVRLAAKLTDWKIDIEGAGKLVEDEEPGDGSEEKTEDKGKVKEDSKIKDLKTDDAKVEEKAEDLKLKTKEKEEKPKDTKVQKEEVKEKKETKDEDKDKDEEKLEKKSKDKKEDKPKKEKKKDKKIKDSKLKTEDEKE